MRLLALPLIAAISIPMAANTAIGHESVHQTCLQSEDYLGCVKANRGSVLLKNSTYNVPARGLVPYAPVTATVHTVTTAPLGNTCPPGYAYMGMGHCREVICTTWRGGRNSPLLRRRKWRCSRDLSAIHLQPGLPVGIGQDPNCPIGEPKLGWQSTCDLPYKEPSKSKRILGRTTFQAY